VFAGRGPSGATIKTSKDGCGSGHSSGGASGPQLGANAAHRQSHERVGRKKVEKRTVSCLFTALSGAPHITREFRLSGAFGELGIRNASLRDTNTISMLRDIEFVSSAGKTIF
jgi:hypothetical protein